MKKEYRTAFFGTPELAATILRDLCESPYKPAIVVTAPDKPAGRGNTLTAPPVKLLAQEYGIEVLQPTNTDELIEGLRKNSFDLFIVAAYGVIIPQSVLDIPAHGTLNVHGSLLPRYRGASPIQAAILEGEAETGPTIMLMDAKMDHGPVLTQRSFPIAEDETSATLFEKMAEEGADLLLETIPHWLEGTINATEQNHEEATYTKLITKEDGHIDWKKEASSLERMVRAYEPWPGTFSFWDGKRIKIRTTTVSTSPSTGTAGTVLPYEDGIAVSTATTLLIIHSLQLEGKRPQDADEFVRTYPHIIGANLS